VTRNTGRKKKGAGRTKRGDLAFRDKKEKGGPPPKKREKTGSIICGPEGVRKGGRQKKGEAFPHTGKREKKKDAATHLWGMGVVVSPAPADVEEEGGKKRRHSKVKEKGPLSASSSSF